MEKKNSARGRLVNLRAVGNEGSDGSKIGPGQELLGIALGFRIVFSGEAEIWTLRGIHIDGAATKEDIGELSFITIPGDQEPATAITGFIAPSSRYLLDLNQESLWQQLRAILIQLGYDQEGFYASIAMGGKGYYFEEMTEN